MTRVGVIFEPYAHDATDLVGAARDAEDAGVEELWLWEDCFAQSGIAAAAVALAVTERLHVGIGIMPMPLRNVAMTAMEIATLARMFPGRLLPGVGHGVQAWMGQAGARVASPLALLSEYAPALRALLAGDELTLDGRYVKLDAVRLDPPPAVAPRVYAAAEGPKTLAVAGASADGVVLDIGRTPGELAAQVALVQGARDGAAADVVAYAVAAFGTGSDEAARARLITRGMPAAGDRVLSGSVEDVAAGVRRLAAAGVDDVVLLPPAEASLSEYLRHAADVARLAAGT